MNDVMLWVGFHALVAAVLVLDLGLLNRKSHVPTFREALAWTGVWVLLGLSFGAGVYNWRSHQAGEAFLAGYLLELALSVDNLFVFIVIFNFFKVPKEYQRRVLFWGIIGALILRGSFIIAGIALVQRFDWLLYVFGAVLIYTGLKMLKSQDNEMDPGDSWALKLIRKVLPMSPDFHGDRFWIKDPVRGWLATPLFTTLIFVEVCDLIFAMDSLPATLGVTNDTFVAYTSNIFAILGLRSMYFFVAGVMSYFRFLSYGLAAVLCFIGSKLMLHKYIEIPTSLSLGVIAGLLAIAIIASLVIPPSAKAGEPHG